MIDEKHIEEEMTAFDKAVAKGQGTVIPTMSFKSDIIFVPNDINFDEVIEPKLKEEIKLPKLTETKRRRDNSNGEMF